jgi:serine/threonine-protein kinase RsbW
MAANHRETVELCIPSRTEHLALVNRVAEEIAEQLSMTQDDRDAVATSVIEAATNAIQHGNRNDASKKVTIRFVVLPGRLEVTVKDQGSGFDPDAVDDPLKPENLLRERGRGVYLIRAFMDEVRFSHRDKQGMAVRLVKYLTPAPTRKEAGG